MGHLTLLTTDIISALARYPPELQKIIEEHAGFRNVSVDSEPEATDSGLDKLVSGASWEEYISGSYKGTIAKENLVLGGPKPSGTLPRATAGWGGDWDDEEEASSTSRTTQELTRAVNPSALRRQTADFGPAPDEQEQEDGGDLVFSPSSSTVGMFGSGNGWSSSSSSEDEDEHEAWINNSITATGDPGRVAFNDHFGDSFAPQGNVSALPVGDGETGEATIAWRIGVRASV